MNYYDEIKEKLLQSEIYDRVKDYSKDRNKVKVYFDIGKLLSEAGKEYGKNIIKQYSEKLIVDVGGKYNERTLYRMRKFYEVFRDEKLTPLVSKLSWSHYVQLISLKDVKEIIYYINVTLTYNYNKRQLQEIIKNGEYKRLPEGTRNKLTDDQKTKIQDYIPNPIFVRNINNYEIISEKILQKIILEDIESFMRELGNLFSFVVSEYKIKLGDRYNYIDLLLYNIKFQCYVVVELKVTELKKEHIGQIQVYMNYIDNHLRSFDEDQTIGIIICKKDNQFIMEYCSDERILRTTYKII